MDILTDAFLLNLHHLKPEVLHYIGHGNKGKLLIENQQAQGIILTDKNLKTILPEKLIEYPKLVFLNACHSEQMANIFVQRGVPVVICVKGDHPIMDKVASIFSIKFYEMLMRNNMSFYDAFYKAIDDYKTHFPDDEIVERELNKLMILPENKEKI